MALVESWDNGKPVRETTGADVPLAIEHFRSFAACLRSQEGAFSQLDEKTIGYHFHECAGIVA